MRETRGVRREAIGLPSPSGGGAGGEGAAGAARPRLADQLRAAAADLAAGLGLPPHEARLEAQVLAAHALGVKRAWLIAHGDEAPESRAAQRLQSALARRRTGEPVAYITGWREFYGREFRVTPDVLIPRPETELLVEAALARLPEDRPARVLDLGTGSGCIAISLALARPRCQVTAVDLSPAALAVARENADRLGARVEFVAGDLFLPLQGRRFDVIVGNPPYVASHDPHLTRGDLPSEPRLALESGADGLDAIRAIAAAAPRHLRPGGHLLLEHGWDQSGAVHALLRAAGLAEVATLRDLAGLPRVSLGILPGVQR